MPPKPPIAAAAKFDCNACPRPCLKGPAKLVGIGFRCWLSGYQTGDIACWEVAWDAFASALGPAQAKRAVGELSCWVRSINSTAQRPIEVYPAGCATFCRDECMAVSMVAASQNSVCPALRACAFALLESPEVEQVVADASAFAATLRELDIVLPPDAIFNAAAAVGRPAAAH